MPPRPERSELSALRRDRYPAVMRIVPTAVRLYLQSRESNAGVFARLAICLPIVFALLSHSACSKQEFTVSDAWIPVPPPHVAVVAGYMTLTNGTDQERTLVGVVGEGFERIEMHQTILDPDTGLARMVKLNDVGIAPGESVPFTPGGHHLMLINPSKSLMEGDTAELELRFTDGTALRVDFDVKPRPALRP